MLVVVDTSVWVSYFRNSDRVITHVLDRLIDDDLVAIVPPVRLELILGCNRTQRPILVKQINAVHLLRITEQTWTLAENFSMDMRSRGITPGVIDILIAAAASECRALVWTLDSDFEPLFKGNYIKAFTPTL